VHIQSLCHLSDFSRINRYLSVCLYREPCQLPHASSRSDARTSLVAGIFLNVDGRNLDNLMISQFSFDDGLNICGRNAMPQQCQRNLAVFRAFIKDIDERPD